MIVELAKLIYFTLTPTFGFPKYLHTIHELFIDEKSLRFF